MNDPKSAPGEWEARKSSNKARLGTWTTAWLVTLAMATFGPIFAWDYNTVATLTGIGVNLAIGVGMIVANKRHLLGLDEMQQRIQLEAMALSLGIGLITGLSYSLLDVTNIVPFHAEISHLVILMGLAYGAGVRLGFRRYR